MQMQTLFFLPKYRFKTSKKYLAYFLKKNC